MQRTDTVRIEIVLYQDDLLGLRIMNINQVTDTIRPNPFAMAELHILACSVSSGINHNYLHYGTWAILL